MFYAPSLLTSKLLIISAYKHQIQYFDSFMNSHNVQKVFFVHYFSIIPRSSPSRTNNGINR